MIAIIDLGISNIYSVVRAFEHVGADIVVTNKGQDVLDADKIVLPGVGSFERGMKNIYKYDLFKTIRECADKNKPILGICLGMQLLMDSSEEGGSKTSGLGLVPGDVRYIHKKESFDSSVKIPNIGWHALRLGRNIDTWDDTILNKVEENSDCYFVHSLCVSVENQSHELASSTYGGVEFSSVVNNNNIVGCQFHPENSGYVGLKIIDNFVK
jgi:glutamine amidotransferase